MIVVGVVEPWTKCPFCHWQGFHHFGAVVHEDQVSLEFIVSYPPERYVVRRCNGGACGERGWLELLKWKESRCVVAESR